MKKLEFLDALRKKLFGLPSHEVEERVSFYSEMIDDRIEDGLSEEDAVADIGTVDGIMMQIVGEISVVSIVKDKIVPKRKLRAWEIVLLALGSPIWLALLISALAVVVSLYAVLWSVAISMWAVTVSLAACALGGVAGLLLYLYLGNSATGFVILGAGVVCAGLFILAIYASLSLTKGTALLAKYTVLWIKGCFIKKEGQ